MSTNMKGIMCHLCESILLAPPPSDQHPNTYIHIKLKRWLVAMRNIMKLYFRKNIHFPLNRWSYEAEPVLEFIFNPVLQYLVYLTHCLLFHFLLFLFSVVCLIFCCSLSFLLIYFLLNYLLSFTVFFSFYSQDFSFLQFSSR